MNKDKVYYAKLYFNQILPQIAEITNQSRYGYHGLSHTNQVAMFGLDLSDGINTDPLPVLLAAGLHDCARTNDAWCTEHGPRAVPIGREFLAKNYANLSTTTVQKILYAIEHHTTGRHAPDTVSACLWDADRIRLSWEMEYLPHLFSTNIGRYIAGMTPPRQAQYIAAQDDFLIKNNILTRAQIEFDREQDRIQNTTVYSNKVR
ncbi:MAG: hypothetical protein IJX89_02885 [Alphaproteobacteria bacterium]|nr:hypothetical protein [Alphaproteobacteria bacterium]